MVATDTGWGVKGMVFRRDEALVLLNPNGGYDLPGGRLEGNETCLVGLRREILEGTGTKKVVVTRSFAPWSFRNGSGRLVKGTLLFPRKSDFLKRQAFWLQVDSSKSNSSPRHLSKIWLGQARS